MLWRSFGTGLFLAIIGIGGTVLALTVFPLIALATRDPLRRQRRIQHVMYVSCKLYCRAIHVLRVADVHLRQTERLQGLRRVLIVANHPSLLDVVMIMAAVPNVQCVVKGGLWKNPFFRVTVQGAGYIRNDLPPDELMDCCVETLKAGNNLVIFPEGTRTVGNKPMKLQRGFANIALMAKADLQFVTIGCDPPLLHKNNPWWRVPPTRTAFSMEAGEGLDIQKFMGYRYRSVAARKVVEYVEQYYKHRLGHGPVGSRHQASDRIGAEVGGFVSG